MAEKGNARSKFRDGLVLALLSLWPIRRRSIAALTLSHHVEFNSAAVNILSIPLIPKPSVAEFQGA